MKNLKYILLIIAFNSLTIYSQENSLLKDYYLSIEPTYRSYGKGDQTGIGIGVEYSKDIKKWLGIGLNLSYWNNDRKSWDFRDPFTNEHFVYIDNIKELRIHPFVQLIPINTKHIDFYVQLGISTGYFNHVFWGGGHVIARYPNRPPEMLNFVEDKGYKGLYLGYDFGIAIRFQFGKFTITPNSIKSFNFQDQDGFDSLNLKIGYNF